MYYSKSNPRPSTSLLPSLLHLAPLTSRPHYLLPFSSHLHLRFLCCPHHLCENRGIFIFVMALVSVPASSISCLEESWRHLRRSENERVVHENLLGRERLRVFLLLIIIIIIIIIIINNNNYYYYLLLDFARIM